MLEPRAAPIPPLQLIEKLLASVWVPVHATGIVLLVIIFVLLEHESLRDRLILEAGHDKRSSCWCFVFGCWLTVRQHGFHMARLLVWGASLSVALRKQHISGQET